MHVWEYYTGALITWLCKEEAYSTYNTILHTTIIQCIHCNQMHTYTFLFLNQLFENINQRSVWQETQSVKSTLYRCKNAICLLFTNLQIHDLATLMPGRSSRRVARYGFVIINKWHFYKFCFPTIIVLIFKTSGYNVDSTDCVSGQTDLWHQYWQNKKLKVKRTTSKVNAITQCSYRYRCFTLTLHFKVKCEKIFTQTFF